MVPHTMYQIYNECIIKVLCIKINVLIELNAILCYMLIGKTDCSLGNLSHLFDDFIVSTLRITKNYVTIIVLAGIALALFLIIDMSSTKNVPLYRA